MKKRVSILLAVLLCTLLVPWGAAESLPAVRSINHRGYNKIAPENTLPAYRLSKEKGFNFVETDVSFTKDGVAVLLHDSTINYTARNPDGSELENKVSISSITYEEALQYDYGLWKGEKYKGTKIPTLAEFLDLCIELKLHPYIELKNNGDYTREQINGLVDMVEAMGLRGKVTWISFSDTYLNWVKEKDDRARLGYLRSSLTESVVKTAKSLRTGSNEVFLDVCMDLAFVNGGKAFKDEDLAMVKKAGIPLEAWTLVDDPVAISNLDRYVSGVTSDSVRYEDVRRKDAALDKAPAAVQGLTDDGTAHELVTAGSGVTGGELRYALGKNADTVPSAKKFSATIPTAKDSGTYYVWYMVAADSSHWDTDPAVVEVTITDPEHHWSDWTETIPATCVSPGEEERTCLDCGTTKTRETDTDPDHHTGRTEVRDAKEPTEEEAGYTGDIYCADCGELLSEGEVIPVPDPEKPIEEFTYDDLSEEEKQQADAIAEGLDTDADTAAQMVKHAARLGVSTDTVKLGKNSLAALTGDADPAGTDFGTLTVRAAKRSDSSVTLQWKKVKSADGYLVYGSKCGKKEKLTLLKTLKGNKTLKYTQKKLKKGTYYRYMVVAYKSVREAEMPIAASVLVHTTTKGAKTTVAKSVKVKKAKVSVKKGKSSTIQASEVKDEKKKSIKAHRKLCYESDNPKVAKVSAKGKITGKKKGSAKILVYAQNGLFTTVKVTVK